MAEKSNEDESHLFHTESGKVVFDKPKSQDEIFRETRENERHEFSRDQVKTNRKLTLFTGFLVLFSLCGTAIGIWQASISQTAANAAKEAAAAATSAAKTADDTLNEMKKNEASSDEQFKTQLNKLDESVKAAARLARATEAANTNAIESDRPWIGEDIQVAEFEVGKSPKLTCTMANSGKRPALILSSHCTSNFFFVFPSEPEFQVQGVQSKTILVPGGVSTTNMSMFFENQPTQYISGSGQPTLAAMQDLELGVTKFFIYGKIEYADIRTGERHFTHSCAQYMPESKAMPKGFYACTQYNEAN